MNMLEFLRRLCTYLYMLVIDMWPSVSWQMDDGERERYEDKLLELERRFDRKWTNER